MKNIIIIAILFFAGSLQTNAQKSDYRHLLDTGKVWTEAMVLEFGDFQITEYYTGNRIVHNDTVYYEMYGFGTLPKYIREDTIEHKVYGRGTSFEGIEGLLYDFSIQVGDSISYSDNPDFYFKLEIKQTENILGVNRTVFYLKPTLYPNSSFIIWIEGIGSLAGIFKFKKAPSLIPFDNPTELNCLHHNNELIYQSENASVYGCHFEIDPDPPVLEEVGVQPDTAALNDTIVIWVVAHDANDITITVTLTAPDGTEYEHSDFTSYPMDFYVTSVSDFHNQTGHWYLSKVVIEDEQNNITEQTYSSDDPVVMFYITEPDDISRINKVNINIYPNPVTNNLYINLNDNNYAQYTIELSDIYGKLLKHKIMYKHNTHIDITKYNRGIYFVKVFKGTKAIYTKKIIKL